jgi:phage-related baseplate assembly protein
MNNRELESRLAAVADNSDRFFGLPYFAIGHVNREDTIANMNAVWEGVNGASPTPEGTAFISRIVDIVERQNALAGVDTGEVVNAAIRLYEGMANTILYPGDPVRIFISTLAAAVSMQNAVSDWTQKQNYLRYATGAYLDQLAALLDVYRLESFPAKTTLRYSLAAPRNVPTAIPKGSRATADGRIFFATDAFKMIPVGQTYVDIPATCVTHGLEGNGLIPGQINRMVDVVAFIASVGNIVESNGGSDVEEDESLRERARLSPGRFSTAGARLSYLYYALTAHGNIGDVSISGPEDRNGERKGEVDIYVMLKGGRIPDEDGAEIQAVVETLNQERVRPLTDKVNVKPINKYDIDYQITWYISIDNGAKFAEIEENIKKAVADYEAWQTERIGRDVNPDRLIQLCLGAGAKRVEISGLEFKRIGFDTVAHIVGSETITGGVESD